MELVLGGLAAVGAGFFSNPLEVVKIRMQLQGELLAKGNYSVHYRNVFHAAYTIATKDGLLALQKGLIPALWYQWVMNGTRLGLYSIADKKGWTRNEAGTLDAPKAVLCATLSGVVGGIAGSPFFLIKTQLQSRANDPSIAVGTQHDHAGRMSLALKNIYRNHGVLGYWRGMSSSIPRIAVASAIQLPTFGKAREFVQRQKLFPENSWLNALCASLISGLFVSFGMAPFDLISTRFYNQSVDSNGRGLLYKNLRDCAQRIFAKEGLSGFFKGWTANYFRVGPHTLLSLVFWDQIKYYYMMYHTTDN